jgi:regulatory protein
MIITAITKQRRGERYNVFVDDRFAAGLSATVLAESGWRENQTITEEELARYRERDEYGKILAKAYDYLSRRPHSVAELKDKLLRKEYPEAVITEVLEHLGELGYLDDADFAARWVTLRGDTRGPALLRQELRKKRVAPEVIEEAVEVNPGDLRLAAETLARKRLERLTGQPWEKVYTRLTSYLSARGYPYDVVRDVMAGLKAELNAAA